MYSGSLSAWLNEASMSIWVLKAGGNSRHRFNTSTLQFLGLANRRVFFPIIGYEVPPFGAHAVETAVLHRGLQDFEIASYDRVVAVIMQTRRRRELVELARHLQFAALIVHQGCVHRYAPA